MNRITLCPTGEWRLYAYDDQPGGAAGFLLERFALDIETRVRAATGLTETAVGLTEGGSRDLTIRTRKGLAWAGLSQVEPARIGVSTVRHWATCARLAVVFERGAVRVWGEPRLRVAERKALAPVASAELGVTGMGDGGCAGRISCCFPLMPGRVAGGGRVSSCRSRAPGGWRGSVGPGRGAIWCRNALLRAAGSGACGFLVPFPPLTPRERSWSCSRRGTRGWVGDGRLAP